MKSIKKIKISVDTTIKQAMKIISRGTFKIAIAVNKKGQLLGTLTDGDIRTGFLNGLNINSSVKSIIFNKPYSVKINENKEKIFKTALSKNIYQIPVIDDNRKVIGLYILDEFIKFKNKSNKVVIMAGGKGLRLRPLTKYVPKSMLKVGDKPILQIIVEKFKESGYENFIICVNYKSKIIKDYFGDGESFGIKIEYIHEKKKMGTAGALSLLKNKPTEPFFVINGDLLINLDFEKMLDFHDKYNSNATMSVKDYNIVSPYGEVNLDGADIVSIEEKPKRKVFVNAGVYILDPKCINLIPKKFYDMPSLFKKIIAKKYKTVSFPLDEYWLDIGRFNDYKRANLEYDTEF